MSRMQKKINSAAKKANKPSANKRFSESSASEDELPKKKAMLGSTTKTPVAKTVLKVKKESSSEASDSEEDTKKSPVAKTQVPSVKPVVKSKTQSSESSDDSEDEPPAKKPATQASAKTQDKVISGKTQANEKPAKKSLTATAKDNKDSSSESSDSDEDTKKSPATKPLVATAVKSVVDSKTQSSASSDDSEDEPLAKKPAMAKTQDKAPTRGKVQVDEAPTKKQTNLAPAKSKPEMDSSESSDSDEEEIKIGQATKAQVVPTAKQTKKSQENEVEVSARKPSTLKAKEPASGKISAIALNVTLFFDHILVEQLAKETKPNRGNYPEAKVVAVGPGARNKNGDVIPMQVKMGDRVLLKENGGSKVIIDGKDYVSCSESEIVAKFN